MAPSGAIPARRPVGSAPRRPPPPPKPNPSPRRRTTRRPALRPVRSRESSSTPRGRSAPVPVSRRAPASTIAVPGSSSSMMIPVPRPVPASMLAPGGDPAVPVLPALVDLAARLLVQPARVARGLDAVAAELALGWIERRFRGGGRARVVVVVPAAAAELVVLHHGRALPRRGFLRLVRRALLPREPVQAQQRATAGRPRRRGGEDMLLLVRVLGAVGGGGLALVGGHLGATPRSPPLSPFPRSLEARLGRSFGRRGERDLRGLSRSNRGFRSAR